MIKTDRFRQIALTFPEATETPHFDIVSFKVKGKIFTTLNVSENRATVKFSLEDQDLFCLFDKNIVYPVPNKWGKMGWTHINLTLANEEICLEALAAAYCSVAPKKQSDLIKFE